MIAETITPIDEPEIQKAKRLAWGRKASRKWAAKNPEKQKRAMRNWHLKKKYGISLEQFEFMLRQQGFACAVCGSGDTGSGLDWNVDHCHATGKVRGLLCTGCNTGLGGFRDNAKIMKAAIKYVMAGGV